MASSDHEDGKGWKARKQPLRRSHSTPYDRPPLAVRGSRDSLPAAVSRGRQWLSNLVDPASRVIANSASRLFSSVYSKRLAAPSGENCNANEDVPELISSPEAREPDDYPFDARLSIQCIGSGSCTQESISCTGDILELEKLVKQKRFSRTETERLTELLHSRIIDAPTLPSADYKNKGKLDEDSNIDAHLSEQVLNHTGKEKEISSEFEDQRKQLVAEHGNVSSRVNVNIPKECFGPPIEIARAYMKSLKAAPSTRLQQSQIWDKGSPFKFKNKQSNSAEASRSAGRFPVLPADCDKDYMSQKPRDRSALHNLPHSPYSRNSMLTNPMEYSPHKGSQIRPTGSIEWTPSNIRHSVHGQSLKRGSSDSDAGGFSDGRRVRQKSCLKDSSSADASSTFFCDQGHRNEVDFKGLENVDDRLPSTSAISVPQSMQMGRKILHQLDKLVPYPKKSSEKKVTFEDASFFKSSLGEFHDGAQKFTGNYYSAKSVNVPGSSLGEPSSATLARNICLESPNKEKAKEIEGTPIPSIFGPEVKSFCFGMNSAVTSSSDTKHSTRSVNLDNYGNTFLSTQKETILQSAPDDKGEFTRAEHAIFSSVKNSMEKSLVHSVELLPSSGLIHNETDTKAIVKSSTGKDASFKFPAAHTSNSLSKPTSAAGTTLNKEVTVSTFKFGSADSTSNAIKFVKLGSTESVQTGETIIVHPILELDNGDSTIPALTYDKSVPSTLFASTKVSASSSNPCFSSAAPRFQFGSGNSSIYSFTGLSTASSSMGNGAPKFQFGSGNSTSYSFTGVASSSSQGGGVSSPVFSSLYPVAEGTGSLSTSSILPISENGTFDVSTSFPSGGLSFPSLGPTAALPFGTLATFSGNGNNSFLNSSVFQFGALDSQKTFGIGSSLSATCSSQFGFATSGAKPFSSSSYPSSSPGASSSLFNSYSLSQASPASICTTTFSSFSSPSFSATLGSIPLASPSTGFSFGITANSSGSMPFASSSGSICPFASTETTTLTTFPSPAQPVFGSNTSTADFGSGSRSNDQMNVVDSRTDGDCQTAPLNPTSGQPASLQAAPSGAQEFQFGNFQNKSTQNSSFHESGNLEFLAGGSFSFGGSGAEKSERRIIRDRRGKRRK